METQSAGNLTVAGTDIEEVKKKNAESGMTYNEVKEMLAKSIAQDAAERKNGQSTMENI